MREYRSGCEKHQLCRIADDDSVVVIRTFEEVGTHWYLMDEELITSRQARKWFGYSVKEDDPMYTTCPIHYR